MKNLFGIFIVLMFIILTSATTATIMQVQPTTPKQTVIVKVSGEYLVETTKPYIRKGYIIKLITGTGGYSRLDAEWVVVFEKY